MINSQLTHGEESETVGWNIYAIWQDTRTRALEEARRRTEVRHIVPQEDGRCIVTTYTYYEKWDCPPLPTILEVTEYSWEDFCRQYKDHPKYLHPDFKGIGAAIHNGIEIDRNEPKQYFWFPQGDLGLNPITFNH